MKKNSILTIIALLALSFTVISCSKKEKSEKKSEKTSTTKMDHNKMAKMGEKPKQTVKKINGFAKKPAIGTKVYCPVMDNTFTVSANTPMTQYKGKYYAFCCGGCKPQFEKNPEKFIKKLDK